MKIAIFSDIHANTTYLKSVLDAIDKHQVGQIYCLGDLVGYYDDPNGAIEIIRKRNIPCIKGNHEKYLLGEIEYNEKKEKIYRIQQQRETISPENIEYLKSLPDELIFKENGKSFYMTHSLPGDCITHVYNPSEIDGHFLKKYDFYLSGHTHIPSITWHYGTCIINPGSVGQPRDYTTLPSFALIDLDAELYYIRKVQVDVKNYLCTLEQQNLHEELVHILKRTKNDG